MQFSQFLILLFLCTAVTAGPFDVPNAEKGKKGLYTVEQPGVPVHEDYAEIMRHNHGRKLEKDRTGQFYRLKHAKAKFKIYVPDSYNPAVPAGIAYIGVEDSGPMGTSIDKSINLCKDFFARRNLIGIAIDAKSLEVGRMQDIMVDYQHEYSVLIRRSIDIVKERYKVDPERVWPFLSFIPCPSLLQQYAVQRF